MKISPLDIYNKEFTKSMRGYNIEEVQDFLDEVGMSYENVLKEMNSLRDENERLKERIKSYISIEDKLEKLFSNVEATAEEKISRAHKKAEEIINQAESKAEQIQKENEKQLEDEYRKLRQLTESKNLFMIRFKTLLENHLEMLEQTKDREEEFYDDVAVSYNEE